MKITVHILNLDVRIVREDGKRKVLLPACAVSKKDKTSTIRIDGEEYDAAILIDVKIAYRLSKALKIPFEEFLDELVIHELCHIFNPDWEHQFEEVGVER